MRAPGSFAAIAVFAALLLFPLHTATGQTSPSIPGMLQVDLTTDSSLRTLQAWKAIKDMGQSLQGNDVNQMHGLYALQHVIGIVQSHGFPDVETWHRTLYTFMLSAGVIGKEAQFENMPENLKTAMAHLLPKPENVEVAKEALENPEVARIYAELK